MQASLRGLLEGVIDYAGLFPPAKLDMPQAWREYVGHRSGPESWLVNRFVCPAARLDELAPFAVQAEGLEVAVIGSLATDLATWEASLEADANAMTAFEATVGDAGEIVCYETRPPADLPIDRVARDLKGFSGIDLYVELPWSEDLDDRLHELSDSEWLFAKARTGGPSAESVPSADKLASFLHTCFSLDVEFKLTAGLHHPFPTRDDAIGATTHGFVNVATACSLIVSEDIPARLVAQVLESAQRDFRFDNSMIGWREHEACMSDILEARDVFHGFGSCSVREPLQDLTQSGLM